MPVAQRQHPKVDEQVAKGLQLRQKEDVVSKGHQRHLQGAGTMFGSVDSFSSGLAPIQQGTRWQHVLSCRGHQSCSCTGKKLLMPIAMRLYLSQLRKQCMMVKNNGQQALSQDAHNRAWCQNGNMLLVGRG